LASEQRSFIFAVTFIILFGIFLSTVPTDLSGAGTTPDMLTPVNPSLLSDFSESQEYNKSYFSVVVTYYQYSYDLGGKSWLCETGGGGDFFLGAKVLIGGVLWLGQLDSCKFISSDGVDRGTSLSFTEMDADAEDGTAQYNLQSLGNGVAMGGFIVYWNTTTYSSSSDAWTGGGLWFLHGIGLTANTDVASLLLQLLFLQLPDCPLLINVLLATPVWATIIYLLWFIIINMIPFLGGG
jgi:hypothetical protein